MTQLIDLRSDTVTRPSEAMRRVMAAAKVGDDVFGEDPTINQLEESAAERLGKQAAIFATSGTQSNLLALLSHCERGEEYIVGQLAHTYKYEAGGAAVLGSIQPQPLDFEPDGTLGLAKVRAAIKPDDYHFARTRLLCLENTNSGLVLPIDYLQEAGRLAREHGLSLHLDGARLFNAAVKLGVSVTTLAEPFDSVSVCLSKGLGAPVGSVLCGSRKLITRARRWRKMVGGGMRQAGILAAAGLIALEENVSRLAEDHANARLLAQGLMAVEGVTLNPDLVQTNMVFITIDEDRAEAFNGHLKESGILVLGHGSYRLVTHLDVSRDDIQRVVKTVKGFFSNAH